MNIKDFRDNTDDKEDEKYGHYEKLRSEILQSWDLLPEIDKAKTKQRAHWRYDGRKYMKEDFSHGWRGLGLIHMPKCHNKAEDKATCQRLKKRTTNVWDERIELRLGMSFRLKNSCYVNGELRNDLRIARSW